MYELNLWVIIVDGIKGRLFYWFDLVLFSLMTLYEFYFFHRVYEIQAIGGILYAPVAIISILWFTLANFVMAPVGYAGFIFIILIQIPMQTNSLSEAFLKFVFLLKICNLGICHSSSAHPLQPSGVCCQLILRSWEKRNQQEIHLPAIHKEVSKCLKKLVLKWSWWLLWTSSCVSADTNRRKWYGWGCLE